MEEWNDYHTNYDLVYFPQMCNINTEAMNNSDITRTGTGPLKNRKRNNSVQIKSKN